MLPHPACGWVVIQKFRPHDVVKGKESYLLQLLMYFLCWPQIPLKRWWWCGGVGGVKSNKKVYDDGKLISTFWDSFFSGLRVTGRSRGWWDGGKSFSFDFAPFLLSLMWLYNLSEARNELHFLSSDIFFSLSPEELLSCWFPIPIAESLVPSYLLACSVI